MEAVLSVGFVLLGEMSLEDDEGSLDKDLIEMGLSSANGISGTSPTRNGLEQAPIEIWSVDEESGTRVGFSCTDDQSTNIFYASPALSCEDFNKGISSRRSGSRVNASGLLGAAAERSTKGAITALLDLAEACAACKITLGLNTEYAGCSEFVCSLLYLGFQVVPVRPSPLGEISLLLELDMAWPSQDYNAEASDRIYTGTSDCSTSAWEQGGLESEFSESNN